MRRRHRVRPLPQGALFTPPPNRPTWDNLPLAVTRNVAELLAELLRRRRLPLPPPGPKEVADE